MSIEEKAKELAEAVKETEEFENLNAAQARVQIDPKAQDLVNQLKQEQEYIQQARSQGEEIQNERIQNYQTLQQQAMNNSTLKKLFEAQEEFSRIMEKVNDTVNKEIFSK